MLSKADFMELVRAVQFAEIEKKRGNSFCDGNSIVKNELMNEYRDAGMPEEMSAYIRAYWNQVVEVSYIMADINWGRNPDREIKRVDEELFDPQIITNMMFLSNRDFDGDFSMKMSSGYYGKLD